MDVPVAIVGAGPVGLSLALGLARHGVRSVVLERSPTTSAHSKAAGVHVRTREVLRRWGVEERLLAEGALVPAISPRDVTTGRPLFTVDLGLLDDEADRPGLLLLEQSRTERVLKEAVAATGRCDLRFGAEVTGLLRRPASARLVVREGGRTTALGAAFVVGCDGAGSLVREGLGLPFEGITYGLRPMLADVVVDDARDDLPWPRLRNAGDGLSFALRLRPGLWRLVHLERRAPTKEEVPDDEVQGRARALLGPGRVEVVWASRFRIHRRAAPRFRVGRVLLAGDAAHVHSPVGGLGMNAGVQDAADLAWKLAAALAGGDVDRLLDAYDVERRAVVVGRVSRFTDVLTRALLQTPAPVRAAAFCLLGGALALPPLGRQAARRLAMLDLALPASPLVDAHDLAAGVRLPDILLRAPDGRQVRLHALLPLGPALLDVAARRPFVPDLPLPAVRIGPGAHVDPSGALRRLLGGADALVLVRPDGHVAWARRRLDGLVPALRRALGAQLSSGSTNVNTSSACSRPRTWSVPRGARTGVRSS
ncbi:MAG: FAD-dependent monooxygenase [Planctomycetes bacterium]|nr:FAD-dependent monooxygenase [Planctomycetota bacterium]